MRLAVDMHDLALGQRYHHCCISDGACSQCRHSGSRGRSIRIDERGVIRVLELRHGGRTLAYDNCNAGVLDVMHPEDPVQSWDECNGREDVPLYTAFRPYRRNGIDIMLEKIQKGEQLN